MYLMPEGIVDLGACAVACNPCHRQPDCDDCAPQQKDCTQHANPIRNMESEILTPGLNNKAGHEHQMGIDAEQQECSDDHDRKDAHEQDESDRPDVGTAEDHFLE